MEGESKMMGPMTARDRSGSDQSGMKGHVKNGFYSSLKSKSIEFEVILKVNEGSDRIELESKNSDDSIRWRIRSGSRDLSSSKGIKKL